MNIIERLKLAQKIIGAQSIDEIQMSTWFGLLTRLKIRIRVLPEFSESVGLHISSDYKAIWIDELLRWGAAITWEFEETIECFELEHYGERRGEFLQTFQYKLSAESTGDDILYKLNPKEEKALLGDDI